MNSKSWDSFCKFAIPAVPPWYPVYFKQMYNATVLTVGLLYDCEAQPICIEYVHLYSPADFFGASLESDGNIRWTMTRCFIVLLIVALWIRQSLYTFTYTSYCFTRTRQGKKKRSDGQAMISSKGIQKQPRFVVFVLCLRQRKWISASRCGPKSKSVADGGFGVRRAAMIRVRGNNCVFPRREECFE